MSARPTVARQAHARLSVAGRFWLAYTAAVIAGILLLVG